MDPLYQNIFLRLCLHHISLLHVHYNALASFQGGHWKNPIFQVSALERGDVMLKRTSQSITVFCCCCFFLACFFAVKQYKSWDYDHYTD